MRIKTLLCCIITSIVLLGGCSGEDQTKDNTQPHIPEQQSEQSVKTPDSQESASAETADESVPGEVICAFCGDKSHEIKNCPHLTSPAS